MKDDGKPLTKQDLVEVLGGLESRLEERFVKTLGGLEARLEERFDRKLESLEERLREYVHDTETRLLTGFHAFATAHGERLGTLEDFSARTTKRLAELEAAGRLSALELRVAEIEKKLDRRQ
jgi:hypothetical protein